MRIGGIVYQNIAPHLLQECATMQSTPATYMGLTLLNRWLHLTIHYVYKWELL